AAGAGYIKKAPYYRALFYYHAPPSGYPPWYLPKYINGSTQHIDLPTIYDKDKPPTYPLPRKLPLSKLQKQKAIAYTR
ncbi:hypothetical protein, partial [Bacillus cereus]